MDPGEVDRFSRRTKTLDVELLPEGRVRFETALVDQSFGGTYEEPDARTSVVHRFIMGGVLVGDDLVLESLDVTAETHPFPQCPFILPATQRLIGLSLRSSWRQTILSNFKGRTGCTHVTTLLLGLSEVTTLVLFQRANEVAAYGPRARASGAWIGRNLALGHDLSGACHALDAGGVVMSRAENYLRSRQQPQ
jgi:hypothetical protein